MHYPFSLFISHACRESVLSYRARLVFIEDPIQVHRDETYRLAVDTGDFLACDACFVAEFSPYYILLYAFQRSQRCEYTCFEVLVTAIYIHFIGGSWVQGSNDASGTRHRMTAYR